MATPYKRVKITKKTGTHTAGTTLNLPADEAEKLVAEGSAQLLGAGSPPKPATTPADTKADKA